MVGVAIVTWVLRCSPQTLMSFFGKSFGPGNYRVQPFLPTFFERP